MLTLSRLSISLLAFTIAAPVLAADLPGSASHPAPAAPTKPAPIADTTAAPKASMVDINTATAADLKALPGMTDADAAKVVQGRPYKDPSELTSKKILSDAEYAKIKDRVVAGHNKS